MLLRRHLIRFVLLSACVALSTPAFAAMRVVPVPQNPNDPNVPHVTTNGRTTLFKAIVREAFCTEVYFRWDFNGDGLPDACAGRTPAIFNGMWYRDVPERIDGAYTFPYLNPAVEARKLYLARVEVACIVSPGGVPTNSVFGSYPVLLYAEPVTPEAAETASPAALEILRRAAVDDALWFLHEQLVRTGSGTADITGYVGPASYALQASAVYALALQAHGRRAAYPPGTYDPAGLPVPAGFTEENDRRYRSDPYAEDAARLTNFLLSQLASRAIPTADEDDDGQPALPGTNDAAGYGFADPLSDELGKGGLVLAALAGCGLQGTATQVAGGPAADKLFETVVQQCVDFAIAAQNDASAGSGAAGGWGWNPCYECAGNDWASHMLSYWTLGLEAAERLMAPQGVHVNQRAKLRLANALVIQQAASGGPRYYSGSGAVIPETVGGALLAARWLGWDTWPSGDATPTGYPLQPATRGQARAVYDSYLGYAAARYNQAGGAGGYIDETRAFWKDGQPGDVTAGYQADVWTLSCSLLAAGAGYEGTAGPLAAIGGHDWRRDLTLGLVEGQHGSTTGSDYFEDPGGSLVGAMLGVTGATGHALLAAAVGNQAPDADLGLQVAGATCEGGCQVPAGQALEFRVTASDYEGTVSALLDFGDGGAAVTVDPRDPAYHAYAAPGSYVATLTATDDEGAETIDTVTVLVGSASGVAPTASFRLHGARPNPFGAATVIAYELAEPGLVSVEVFDLSGHLVRRLAADVAEPAGSRQVGWDGRDGAGNPVASGVYLCRVSAGAHSATQRLLLWR